MSKRVASVILLMLASGGCRICSDCTDYSSPLADSPYSGMPGRAGSAFNGTVLTPTTPQVETPPPPPPVITQPPGVVAPAP